MSSAVREDGEGVGSGLKSELIKNEMEGFCKACEDQQMQKLPALSCRNSS